MQGGCLCGAIRFETTEEPLATRTCWCRVCQYIGAGSATVNAIFRRAAVKVSGELQEYACLADSGNHMHRQFCGRCGTHLFAHVDERPQVLVVRVGTLDNREGVRPTSTIWVDSAPSWGCIDAALPTVAKQPPPVG